MLYRLEIENFFSVRDAQVVNLEIAPNVTDLESRYAPIYPGSEVRAPKVVALYGSNAAGKTNVLKALEFLAGFARDSAQRAPQPLFVERFNDEESASRPIRLAVEFGGVMGLSSETFERAAAGEEVEYGAYRYELEIGLNAGVLQRVNSESLKQRPLAKGKWQRVFERDDQGKVLGSKSFPVTGFRHLETTLGPLVSVLSSYALFQHPTASIFVERLRGIVGTSPIQFPDVALVGMFTNQPKLIEMLNRDLRRIDVGVEAMRMVDTPNGPAMMFRHDGLQVEMPWGLESHGTRSFIKLFPFLTTALEAGGIAIVDELDVSIHPLVLPDLVRWFYDSSHRNKHDAQLWFSCHSASLLEELTKEEVILCEKDHQGRTKTYSLMDVKSVRRDDNLYRKYLSGAYGAVPSIA